MVYICNMSSKTLHKVMANDIRIKIPKSILSSDHDIKIALFFVT